MPLPLLDRLPETRGWLDQYMPEALRHQTLGNMMIWQWLALPVVLVLAVVLGLIAARILCALLTPIVRRTRPKIDDQALPLLRMPFAVGGAGLAAQALLPLVNLPADAERVCRGLTHGLFLFSFFWGLFRVVDVARATVGQSHWAQQHGAARALVPLAGRVIKVLLGAMALIAFISQLGYPVASLIAGLGIGGLVLALAGQKTVENLFGAFALSVDQPFRPGDFVKVDDIMGTVEVVGLRSTRIRTPDHTTIAMPNGRLAELKIECFAGKDQQRWSGILHLDYGTSAQQLERILREIGELMAQQPGASTDGRVRLAGIGDWSIDVEILAVYDLTDYDQFVRQRQELVLGALTIVERAGATVAYPARTLRMATSQPVAARREAPRPRG